MKPGKTLTMVGALIALQSMAPAIGQSYCTGTYGGGDYRISYAPKVTNPIANVVTTPSVLGKVSGIAGDKVTLDIGQKDGVRVGDKFRIERTSTVQEGDSQRSFNQVVGEISITRVDETGCTGLLLSDRQLHVGDQAISTRRKQTGLPDFKALPSAVAYGTHVTATPSVPSSSVVPVETMAKAPAVPTMPISVDNRPADIAYASPAAAVTNSPILFGVSDYLGDAPQKQLDIWAAGHTPLKVYVQSADRVKGYRPAFNDLVKKAFVAWTEASQNKLQFQYVGDADSADIEVKWTYERDDLAGNNELGITHTLRSDEGIEKATIRLLTSSTAPSKRVTDSAMWITTLHEIGHALGLSHSSSPEDVMNAVLRMDRQGETTLAGLTARDVQSINHLYGNSRIFDEIMKRHQQAIASRTEPTVVGANN